MSHLLVSCWKGFEAVEAKATLGAFAIQGRPEGRIPLFLLKGIRRARVERDLKECSVCSALAPSRSEEESLCCFFRGPRPARRANPSFLIQFDKPTKNLILKLNNNKRRE